jgi:hypothetical protein
VTHIDPHYEVVPGVPFDATVVDLPDMRRRMAILEFL